MRAHGYTPPTVGDPVTLPGGEVLIDGGEPCMYPLMRQTSVAIDQAGNVWAVDNWKPTFSSDFSPCTGDPGGVGVVIFVGLAKPPRTKGRVSSSGGADADHRRIG